MKQALIKLFTKTNIEPVLVGLGIFLILTFLIFPGLTESNTLINIISALGAILLSLFVFYYLGGEKINTKETELNHIPQEELKTKTRTKKTVVPKQSHKKIKPLTEGKVKSQIKTYEGDLPMTQAPPAPKPKVEKVMGEYQLNNKEKVRKSLVEGRVKSQSKSGTETTKATPPPKPPKLK